jgi:hypothetical protein
LHAGAHPGGWHIPPPHTPEAQSPALRQAWRSGQSGVQGASSLASGGPAPSGEAAPSVASGAGASIDDSEGESSVASSPVSRVALSSKKPTSGTSQPAAIPAAMSARAALEGNIVSIAYAENGVSS